MRRFQRPHGITWFWVMASLMTQSSNAVATYCAADDLAALAPAKGLEHVTWKNTQIVWNNVMKRFDSDEFQRRALRRILSRSEYAPDRGNMNQFILNRACLSPANQRYMEYEVAPRVLDLYMETLSDEFNRLLPEIDLKLDSDSKRNREKYAKEDAEADGILRENKIRIIAPLSLRGLGEVELRHERESERRAINQVGDFRKWRQTFGAIHDFSESRSSLALELGLNRNCGNQRFRLTLDYFHREGKPGLSLSYRLNK